MLVHPSINANLLSTLSQSLEREDSNHYTNKYFQILVVELPDDSSGIAASNIKTKLVAKTKEDFNKTEEDKDNFTIIKYNFEKKEWERDKTIGDQLPSKGVIVKEDFLPIKKAESQQDYLNNLSKYPTVRYLLQCRRLSQLIAKTWLPKKYFNTDWERDSVRCIREIFLSANVRPDECDPPLNQISTSGSDTDYIIKPDWLNQEGIRLSLLLAGQAYLWVPPGKYSNDIAGYLPICQPILSTYEIVYEYAFKVTWDSFYASRVDLAQAGVNEKPPYHEVTLNYPPRPSLDEFTTLTESKIKTWVTASEEDKGDSYFPFYPPKNEQGQYVSDAVRHVVPPYPYIPLSCS